MSRKLIIEEKWYVEAERIGDKYAILLSRNIAGKKERDYQWLGGTPWTSSAFRTVKTVKEAKAMEKLAWEEIEKRNQQIDDLKATGKYLQSIGLL
jgi:hypothetical protein